MVLECGDYSWQLTLLAKKIELKREIEGNSL